MFPRISTIANWLRHASPPSNDGAPTAALADVPRYPPYDQGLPCIAVEELLDSQRSVLAQIHDALALGERHRSLIDAVIRRFAAHVHLLPLTRHGAYRGAGGMLRHGLDVAFRCVQLAEEAMFEPASATSAQRRHGEPRWRYATFITGLTRGLHFIVVSHTVTDGQGETWRPLLAPLTTWALERRCLRYYVQWVQEPSLVSSEVDPERTVTAMLLPGVLSHESLDYLGADTNILTATLSAAMGSGWSGGGATLHTIVERAHDLAVQHDLETNPEYRGSPGIGVHPEPYMVDAMRECVRRGQWSVNTERALVYHGGAGTFILWPTAAVPLQKALRGLGVPSVPRDPATLADIMLRAKLLQPNPAAPAVSWLWRIKMHGTELKAVRLLKPMLLWPDDEAPPPVEIVVKGHDPGAPAAETAEAPAASGGEEPPEEETNEAESWGLNEGMALILRALAEDIQASGRNGQIVWLDEGVAVSVDALGRYGVPADDVIDDLANAGWVKRDPMRPGILRRSIAFGPGAKRQAVLLDPEHASRFFPRPQEGADSGLGN